MERLNSTRMATKRDGDKQQSNDEEKMVWIPKRQEELGQTQKYGPYVICLFNMMTYPSFCLFPSPPCIARSSPSKYFAFFFSYCGSPSFYIINYAYSALVNSHQCSSTHTKKLLTVE